MDIKCYGKILGCSDKWTHEEKPVETKHNTDKSDIEEVNRLYWWQKVLMLIGCASLIYLVVQLGKLWKCK